MKFIFSFATLLCLLQSCTTYYFTTPQPAGGEKISEIPENLRGTWNCGYDSSGERKCDDEKGYVITANEIKINDNNEPINWKIGQDVELLKLDDFFVLNLIEKDKMYNSKGKQVKSQLYSALVISESDGAITIWNVDRPWDAKSARKFRNAVSISNKMEVDTMSNDSYFILNFSLNQQALSKISLLKPWMILGSDSIIINSDDIDWEMDYNCGELNFEKQSDERKYYRLENKKYRMNERLAKMERKQNVLIYNDQFIEVFGDVQKGYMLAVTEDDYSDTTQYKHELFIPEDQTKEAPKYEVYQLIEFDKEVVPAQYNRLLLIDPMMVIPNEIAQDLIKSNRISFVTFTEGGKPVERGVNHWNHLSDEDKEFLQQFIVKIEVEY